MNLRPFFVLGCAFLCAAAVAAPAQDLPPGYWPLSRSQPLLDKTLSVHLAPDLSTLTADEKQALEKLLQVGRITQGMYESFNHRQAREAYESLLELDRAKGSPRETQNLLTLFRLFQGPIATTPENERMPFLPVDDVVPGKNVYPWSVSREELDADLAAFPQDRPAILGLRTVVRRSETPSFLRDLSVLRQYPTLDGLHPLLRPDLEKRMAQPTARTFYAVPYSIAWADETWKMYGLLLQAAALMQQSDADFAQYLSLRARDFLTDDYEAGDAAWVSGDFHRLNAQIGAYEPYDDELFGTKTFPSVSLLLRDDARSAAVRSAIQGMQDFEDSLPYDRHKKVREDIPVGVYHVIADFGQARGTNTASILPNEPQLARKYGRTILMRYNILTNPDLLEGYRRVWEAAIDSEQAGDLQPDGGFYRTLWHELGHYLGPSVTDDGRPVGDALEEYSTTMEEMKADLVSLDLAKMLQERGYYDEDGLRRIYASGIHRVLRPVRPRRSQPYSTMQLMQMNYFLEHGLLRFDAASETLHIDYEQYHDVVSSLLREVLALQSRGDKQGTTEFVDRYTTWDPNLHEKLAQKMRAAQRTVYRLVTYAALGE